MHVSVAFTLLALAANTLAAPTKKRAVLRKRNAPNVQSCTATQDGMWATYGVNIGIGYADGSGCDNVYNALPSGIWLTDWQCIDDGSGNTQHYFSALTSYGSEINASLKSMYPAVEGGFNYPDY